MANPFPRVEGVLDRITSLISPFFFPIMSREGIIIDGGVYRVKDHLIPIIPLEVRKYVERFV